MNKTDRDVVVMTIERITIHNIDYAVQIQSELFPRESASVNYEDSLDHSSGYEYFLLYENGVCVGITGIYNNLDNHESAWLGWFGIREPFRRQHLGSEALRIFEEMAAAKGYRFARLYTDAENNDAAMAFYQSNGYVVSICACNN